MVNSIFYWLQAADIIGKATGQKNINAFGETPFGKELLNN
ncbi:hypothetical protein AEST_25850 [Alishewanella aestuarii B11]|uniref:Uncharacterized protein n=2 Tax=Alishewanella aestuarii TaxID=453835 RepID=J2IBR2_9ALTE|nr:hypothetical protein AEST_25850 [Alishewanella aestuarii B11]